MIELFAPKNYGFQPCCYHEATLQMKADAAGGCGPGGFGDKFVPDTLWGLSVKPSCEIHDWTYYYGETNEDKNKADRIFLNNMIRQIKDCDSWGMVENLRLRRARTYYNMVSWFGGGAFYANINDLDEMA